MSASEVRMQIPVGRTILCGTAIALVASGYLHAAGLRASVRAAGPRFSSNAAVQAPLNGSSNPSTYRSILDRYCVTCHNDRLRTANLVLAGDKVDVEHVGSSAEVWEKVLQKLKSGAMPPPGLPRPDSHAYEGFASWLEGELDQAAAANPQPGTPTAHRLNRTEYTNAIRDLLALDISGLSLLPADDMSFGFDNNADLLSVSPGLLERYLAIATRIGRLAVGDSTMRPVAETYKVSSLLLQDDRLSEDLPFGSRGGMAFRHYFPLDAEYMIRIRLQRDGIYNIRGLAEPQRIEIRLDGVRVREFTVGGQSAQAVGGSYRNAAETEAALEVRLPVRAGLRMVGVSFQKHFVAPGGVVPSRLPVANFILSPTARALGFAETMGVASVQIAGPHDGQTPTQTPSRDAIFVCRPSQPREEESCARKILGRLARGAYRRPATDEDVATLLTFYHAGRRGASFDGGIQRALTRILVDPEFLFRVERAPAGVAPLTAYRLTDLQIASRLSFFLWSSIPDDALLDAAARGTLKDPAVLAAQVGRMLADRRSSALVGNFAAQWLHLRNMRAVAPDVNLFPEFDDNLRDALQRETELFVESQIRDDRGVGEMLTANYTFLNERLARHYGIPNVYGSRFRRVTFSDSTRGGLLGQGSVLTITSHATRTSPVLRGRWVLDNVLGAPPPPPPPDVPALPDRASDGAAASLRERLEQHRTNAVCASCHSRMDPLGFALENFDGIGKWRTTDEAERPIDTSGALPDGTKFAGPSELRSWLVAHREEFAATVTTKLLTYALGRGVEYYDRPAIRAIVRDAAATDYRWSSIILGIARSVPFQMRRSEP